MVAFKVVPERGGGGYLLTRLVAQRVSTVLYIIISIIIVLFTRNTLQMF